MTDSTGQQNHAPTVLAVSRYGTFCLLDARSGALRWQLVNGCQPAIIDHGGQMIFVTYTSRWTVRRDTRKPPLRSELPWKLNRPPEEVRQFHELLVTPAEILALRAEDGSVVWRRDGWVSRSQPLPLIHGGHHLDVLDSASGELAWSCEHTESPWYLSPGGVLVAELDAEADRSVVVRRTSDGRSIAQVSVSPLTRFLGLTDGGIVYLTGGPEWRRWIEAFDTSTGETTRLVRQLSKISPHVEFVIY